MIKENHEHLADREVLSTGVNVAHYSAQLLNHSMGVNMFRLGHQFNHSLTIKRFNMMKKSKSSGKGIIRYLLIVPAMLVTMGLFTGMTAHEKPVKGKVFLADNGGPATGATVLIQGSTIGTVVDREGGFVLSAEEEDILVISFVGFATQKIKVSELSKKPILLENKSYRMDLSDVPRSDSEAYQKKMKMKEKEEQRKQEALKAKQAQNQDQVQQSANAEKEEVFFIVEDMPQFPGGRPALKTYIYSNLDYPAEAKKKGLEGKVLVEFTVPVSGELEDISVVKSSDKVFNDPAVNVFKDMPDWEPGKQRGKPVKAKIIVPVEFTLDKE
jgi:TonB family protein